MSGDESDEDDEDDVVEEDLGFISPLENVDPYATFKNALTGKDCAPPPLLKTTTPLMHALPLVFQEKNPALYQISTTALDIELQTVLMEAIP